MNRVVSQKAEILRPQYPSLCTLSEIVQQCQLELLVDVELTVQVSGLSLSSRNIFQGDLYAALPGQLTHGAKFAQQACEAGALAIFTDRDGYEQIDLIGIPCLVVENPRDVLGNVARCIYGTGSNSATIFGITGTNGKTSTAYILDAILRQLGVLTGMSTTVERRSAQSVFSSTLTTPEASELHALIARMKEDQVQAISLEVSAQAITQKRVDGIIFDVAGFTNLSHDHLDDYATYEEYYEAKKQLFDSDRCRQAVVNVDSSWGKKLAEDISIPCVKLSSSFDAQAQWVITIEDRTLTNTYFSLTHEDGRQLYSSVPLLGDFMAINASLAIVMLVESGYEFTRIREVLEGDKGVDVFIPGRVERLSAMDAPAVFIDYGHTPDAFRETLGALRKVTSGNIIMVFGADGDRDTTKRHQMGALAAEGADIVIVCDFHPRFEDPHAIRAALLEGVNTSGYQCIVYEIADPATAFREALTQAQKGDVVLYAGPGHEHYREVAGVKLPYWAKQDSCQALKDMGWLE